MSPTSNNQGGKFFGKYRGKVSNTDDPKKVGRIKAVVPEVLGDVETGWALPCVPFAGDGMGHFHVPPPDSGVWIEFEAGNVSRPIWSGCWWAEGQTPKDHTGKEAEPKMKLLRSEEGLIISLDDEAKTIAISDEDGNNFLEIKVQGGQVKLEASSKAIVEAPQIELVEGGSHPVVFGDKLLQYLNQMVQTYAMHTHPGQTAIVPVTPAPPVPPMQPATADLISTKVKSG